MRQAEWELQRYERLKPMIVEVIKTHGSYAIFNMHTGEVKLWKSVEPYLEYSRECSLKGTTCVLVQPRLWYFRIQFEAEDLAIKQEYYYNDKFELDYEYIIEDHPELQFNFEALADALVDALKKAKRSA